MRKKLFNFRITGLIIGMGFIGSCYYDNEATLYPGNCSPVGVTYRGFVRPFIDTNCTCHVQGSRNGSLSLDGYSDAKAAVISGRLMRSIKHESGIAPMPPFVPKRSACEISKLESWINEGALDN